MKNNSKHIKYKASKTSRSVGDCVEECRRRGWCHSVSYTNSSSDSGNCLLSDIMVEKLSDVQEKNTFDRVKKLGRRIFAKSD